MATSETTTSTSYADLTTTTDTVTVTIGNSGMALVMLQSLSSNTGGTNTIGFAISGASTVAAGDPLPLFILVMLAVFKHKQAVLFGYWPLAGSTTFKMKYKVSAGTGTFANRRISVVPFP